MIRAPMVDPHQYRSRIVEVSEHHSGQRLDNFLMAQLKGVPRSHIYRIVRTGQVRVNRSRAQPKSRLQLGDHVRIPPIRVATRPSPLITAGQRRVAQRIVFEDDYLFVIDKPAGIAVHAGTTIPAGLIDWLRAARPEQEYLELVHRLDRDTSGCLLIAKSRSTLIALQELLRQHVGKQHRIRKSYLALVKGGWQGGPRHVNVALKKNVLRSGERLVRVSSDGQRAVSYFRPRVFFETATLVDVDLITGRTHQARVHAAYLGHPIGGDTKYGDKGFNSLMREYGLNRLFLHASRLEFRHPVTGRKTTVKCPLPLELETVLHELKTYAD
jgi:23S rRNA pseudouridine955/2504/2580 synthase